MDDMKIQVLKYHGSKIDKSVDSYLIGESFAKCKVMSILNTVKISPEGKKLVYDQIENLSKNSPFKIMVKRQSI